MGYREDTTESSFTYAEKKKNHVNFAQAGDHSNRTYFKYALGGLLAGPYPNSARVHSSSPSDNASYASMFAVKAAIFLLVVSMASLPTTKCSGGS